MATTTTSSTSSSTTSTTSLPPSGYRDIQVWETSDTSKATVIASLKAKLETISKDRAIHKIDFQWNSKQWHCQIVYAA